MFGHLISLSYVVCLTLLESSVFVSMIQVLRHNLQQFTAEWSQAVTLSCRQMCTLCLLGMFHCTGFFQGALQRSKWWNSCYRGMFIIWHPVCCFLPDLGASIPSIPPRTCFCSLYLPAHVSTLQRILSSCVVPPVQPNVCAFHAHALEFHAHALC